MEQAQAPAPPSTNPNPRRLRVSVFRATPSYASNPFLPTRNVRSLQAASAARGTSPSPSRSVGSTSSHVDDGGRSFSSSDKQQTARPNRPSLQPRRSSAVSDFHRASHLHDPPAGGYTQHKESYLDTLTEEVHGLFIQNLPHEYLKSLPPWYMYSFGAIAYGTIVAIALTFFVFNFNTVRAQKFLSPIFDPQLCSIVQRPLTGTFLADLNGNWEGTTAFDYSQAVYSVSFSNFTSAYMSSFTLYNQLFNTVKTTFEGAVRPIFESQNLAQNLAFMCNFAATASTQGLSNTINAQVFGMAAEAGTIFDLEIISAGLGDWLGFCDVEPSVTYDSSTFFWTITWDYDTYIASMDCVRVFDPARVGFIKSQVVNPLFVMKIDVRSFMVLVGVNSPTNAAVPGSTFNMAKTDFDAGGSPLVLRRIKGANVTFEGLDVARYYDVRHPGMTPLVCVTRVGGSPPNPGDALNISSVHFGKCLYDFGGLTLGLPYLDHFGAFTDALPKYTQEEHLKREGVYCDCSTDIGHGVYTTPQGSARYNTSGTRDGINNCNRFDFLHGFMIFSLNQDAHIRGIIHMLFEVPNEVGVSTITKRGYKAAWHTPPHVQYTYPSFLQPTGTISLNPPPALSASERAEAFSFCATPYGNCTLLMMRSVQKMAATEALYSINPYYVQLKNSSCNFEVMTPAFAKLAAKPPQPLEESYYICGNSVQEALITAVGNAYGTTAATAPISILLLIHAVLFLQWFFSLYIPRTYTSEEKAEIIDAVATKMLVIRDARHREEHADRLHILTSLLTELKDTHEESQVYFRNDGLAEDDGGERPQDGGGGDWNHYLAMLKAQARQGMSRGAGAKGDDDASSSADAATGDGLELGLRAGAAESETGSSSYNPMLSTAGRDGAPDSSPFRLASSLGPSSSSAGARDEIPASTPPSRLAP